MTIEQDKSFLALLQRMYLDHSDPYIPGRLYNNITRIRFRQVNGDYLRLVDKNLRHGLKGTQTSWVGYLDNVLTEKLNSLNYKEIVAQLLSTSGEWKWKIDCIVK